MIAVYMRYSSVNQDGNLTIEAQTRRCAEFIKGDGRLKGLAVREFADRAISGGAFANRPAYMEVERAAARGEITAVVVYKWDRLGRTLLESLKAIERLERHGAKVYSATEPNDETARNIMLAIAQSYVGQLAERSRDGMIEAVRQGWFVGHVPYGYRLKKVPDPTGKVDCEGRPVERTTLELDPEQAPLVRRIYELYRDGQGFKVIASALNDEGVASARGGSWDASSIRVILRNEMYRGKYVFNQRRMVKDHEKGTRIPKFRPESEFITIDHPEWRIVSEALYSAVHARIADMEKLAKARLGGAGDVRAAGKGQYLLTGLVRCGECGETHGGRMIAQKTYSRWTRSDGQAFQTVKMYLRCNRHNRRGDAVCKNGRGVRMDEIEEGILKGMEQELFSEENVKLLTQDIEGELKKLALDKGTTLARLEREKAALSRKIDRLLAVFEGGDGAGLDAVRVRVREYEARRAEIDRFLRTVKPEGGPGGISNLAAKVKARIGKSREIVARLLRQGRQEAAAFRAELSRYIKAVRVYSDGLVKVTASLAGALEGVPDFSSTMVAGGGFEPPTSGL